MCYYASFYAKCYVSHVTNRTYIASVPNSFKSLPAMLDNSGMSLLPYITEGPFVSLMEDIKADTTIFSAMSASDWACLWGKNTTVGLGFRPRLPIAKVLLSVLYHHMFLADKIVRHQ